VVEQRPRLVLVCGLPGSGKTTLARKVADELPAVRLCPDEWMTELGIDLWDEAARDRIERLFWQLAQELLRHRQSVVLESGFWLRSERDEMRLGGRALGAAVELRYLPASIDELVRRLERRRAEGGPGTVTISRANLERFLSSFEAPDAEEIALFDPPATRAASI
jgi:predicted kinase